MVVTKIGAIADFVLDPNLLGRFLRGDVFAGALDLECTATATFNDCHAGAKGRQNAHNDVNQFHALTLGWIAAPFNAPIKTEAAPC